MLQCHIHAYVIAVVTVSYSYALASVDCAYNCARLSLCFVFLCPFVLCVVLFIFCLYVLLWALLPELK